MIGVWMPPTLGEEIAATTFRHLRPKHRWMPDAETSIRSAARRLGDVRQMSDEALFKAIAAIVRGEMVDG